MTRITLACVGDEQESWGRTAFGSPRHYYLMPAPLLLARVLAREGWDRPAGTVCTVMLNRGVQDAAAMTGTLAATAPRILGLSCYSWNLADNLALARNLTRGGGLAAPLIILGGPAVAFGDPALAARLLEREPAVAAVALGEGEPVISALVRALVTGAEDVPAGCVVRTPRGIAVGQGRPPVARVEEIPEIDMTVIDVPRSAEAGLAAVVQTCRGCPYSCAYCSFHGGAGGIRRLPLEQVERELGRLFSARIEAVHFADSVFDIAPERARRILSFCAENNRQTSLFCYAAFQRADAALGELFERTRIQIGVGLQSADQDVLARVGRRFDVERFREAMAAYGERDINCYVDLMFGLPGDSLDGFRRTVDVALATRPRMLMPFPLTLIARAPLGADPAGYGVARHDERLVGEEVAPMSGLIYADIGLGLEFDLADLRRFDDFAIAVFFAMQRHPESFRVLLDYARSVAGGGGGMDGFALLEAVGSGIRERLGNRPVTLTAPPALGAVVYEVADRLLASLGAMEHERRALGALLRFEGKLALALERPDRRRRFGEVAARETSAVALEGDGLPPGGAVIGARIDHVVTRLEFAWDDLLRLHELRGDLSPAPGLVAAALPFDDWRAFVHSIDEPGAALLDLLPAGRTARLEAVAGRLGRRFGETAVRAALARLCEIGLIGMYRAEPPA